MRADDLFRDLNSEFPQVQEAAEDVDPPFFLAANVYRLRVKRRMTQEDLAQAAGMRQPRIAEIERGDANPTLSTLAKIARALNVAVDALLADPARTASEEYRHAGIVQ